MGLPLTLNVGVENAEGEYIHFMDSDDLINPGFYESMISEIVKAEADVAACSVFYEKKPTHSIWFRKSEVLSTVEDKIEKTLVTVQGWAWRYLIKKGFWSSKDLSFPDLAPMEDLPVMISMIYYANKVALCPSAVYFYKNRENSILNKDYDPVRKKHQRNNRHKALIFYKEFMRTHKIKEPSRLLYSIKRRFM
jgi:glycosyltransferase involved in cell wall biosynthesis